MTYENEVNLKINQVKKRLERLPTEGCSVNSDVFRHDFFLTCAPLPDGMHTHTLLYWLADKDTDENPSRRGTTTPRLCALSDLKAKLKTNHTDWGVSKQTQGITTTGRTLDLWSINKPQILSGTIVISNSTKSVRDVMG